MLALLSPAKKQDFSAAAPTRTHTAIPFPQHTATLVNLMRQHEPADLQKLQGISEKLAMLNFERYLHFDTEHYTLDNSKQALFAFQGDVYRGLEADTLSPEALAFAQDHVAILSGLYGLLRPLDLIQAHRLEMGTKLANDHGQHLYAFWGNQLTDLINQRLQKTPNPTVVNLASKEYSQAIQSTALNARWLTIEFKEHRDGEYKVVGLLAKRARGMMARFIAKQQVTDCETLKTFDVGGYHYNGALSGEDVWVFTR